MLQQIRTLRALAEAFAFEANERRNDSNARLLVCFSAAFSRAAQSIDDADRAACGKASGDMVPASITVMVDGIPSLFPCVIGATTRRPDDWCPRMEGWSFTLQGNGEWHGAKGDQPPAYDDYNPWTSAACAPAAGKAVEA